MELKIFSFFSGAGFLDLGFEHESYEIVFVNEINESFLKVYKYAREKMNYNEPALGYHDCDINDFLKGTKKNLLSNYIETYKENSLVGFIGGPPCPDFSVAGKNKGITGNSGKLTNSYKRIILQQQPDFFLFENVKGLWATKKHREEYERLKKSFLRKGYIMTEKLVNSLEYGVAQDRERIILIGVHRDICCEGLKSMKEKLRSFNWGNKEKYSLEIIKRCSWPEQDIFLEDIPKECPVGVIKELTIEHWFEKNDVYNHPNAIDFFIPRQGKIKMETISEGDVSRKSYKRLHRWRYSPTVAYGNNEVHLHPYKSRRLSVAEALSLQSVPREYIVNPNLPLTVKFKTIGNGVPYLMSKGIAGQLRKFLNEYVDIDKVKGR